jgi:hypothetical protein
VTFEPNIVRLNLIGLSARIACNIFSACSTSSTFLEHGLTISSFFGTPAKKMVVYYQQKIRMAKSRGG